MSAGEALEQKRQAEARWPQAFETRLGASKGSPKGRSIAAPPPSFGEQPYMQITLGDLNDERIIDLLHYHVTTARAQTAPGSAHALDLKELQSSRRHGFVECPPFADYVQDPNSIFMTLDRRR